MAQVSNWDDSEYKYSEIRDVYGTVSIGMRFI